MKVGKDVKRREDYPHKVLGSIFFLHTTMKFSLVFPYITHNTLYIFFPSQSVESVYSTHIPTTSNNSNLFSL